jgi:hypothetical protein
MSVMKSVVVLSSVLILALIASALWQSGQSQPREGQAVLQNVTVEEERLNQDVRLQPGQLYKPAPAGSMASVKADVAAENAAQGAGPNSALVGRSKTITVQLAVFEGIETPASHNPETGPIPGNRTTVQNPDKGKLVYLVSGDTLVPCSEVTLTGDPSTRPPQCSWAITVDATTGEVLNRFWGSDLFCKGQGKQSC